MRILKSYLNSDKFINLKDPLLELQYCLKKDDLCMNKIEIWESLLKWGFAQQNIKNEPTKWNKDDITKIERSLHRFIPLINFGFLLQSLFIATKTSYHKI